MTDSVPAAYGFCLDEQWHRRLRSRPPESAVAWVESQLGARMTAVRALEGGMSSAVHALSLVTPTGTRLDVVLRRYVLDWVREEPWAPGNEATVLRLLNAVPAVPSPRLLAADPDGRVDGTPMIVMSALPGTVVWDPANVETWLRRLAEMLPTIHCNAVSPELSEWAPYPPEPGLVPPPWTKHQRAWERALEAYAGPQPPQSDPVFLHRDFHPGNVLWVDEQISGVVDWVSSCVGPAEEDVSHCRVDLAQHHGQAQADRFLAYWQDVTGAGDYDPYWDLTNVLSMVSEEPDPALDEFVAAAAARMG